MHISIPNNYTVDSTKIQGKEIYQILSENLVTLLMDKKSGNSNFCQVLCKRFVKGLFI